MSTNNYKPSEMANAIRSIGKIPVNIQDILTPEDEGKVVNNNTLVAQTAHEIVTENGTIDTSLNNSVTINVNSNPNYMEVIGGTIANPWGNVDPSGLYNELLAGNITLQLVVYNSVLMATSFNSGAIFFGTILFDLPEDLTPMTGGGAMYIPAESGYGLYYAKSYTNGNWSDLPTSLASTLIIIHHPIPVYEVLMIDGETGNELHHMTMMKGLILGMRAGGMPSSIHDYNYWTMSQDSTAERVDIFTRAISSETCFYGWRE